MHMPADPQEMTILHPKTIAGWRKWLSANHASSVGISLVIAKKGSGIAGISYEAAVEEALCFGWIDSRTNSLDETRYRLQMTPRKPRSIWSNPNKRRVERLIEEGRMAPAGLAKIEAAKEDGSWTRLEAIDRLEIPADLRRALSANLKARRNFAAFNDSSKKVILYWITNAKRAETRQKRIEETVRLAADNIKAAHPQ